MEVGKEIWKIGNRRKIYNGFLIALLVMCSLAISCDDIFEEDITDDEIILLFPADGAIIENDSLVTLSWEFLDGASLYDLELVTPSFSSGDVRLVFDSLATTTNRITIALDTGCYEWAVSGFNNGFATDFFIRSFSVVSTAAPDEGDDFSTASVTPIAPLGTLTNNQVLFIWEELEGAVSYDIQVVSPSFTSPLDLLYDTAITDTNLSLNVPDGSYEWRVRASNADSLSTPYATLGFEVATPSNGADFRLNSPADGIMTNATSIEFGWEEVENISFYVLNVRGPMEFSETTNNNTVLLSLGESSGDYEWSVTAVTAEDQTFFSDTLSFTYLNGEPPASLLIAPVAGAELSVPIDFSWRRLLDSIAGDSLYLYDETMELVEGYPQFFSEESTVIESIPNGVYFWDLRTVDRDERVSAFSIRRTFTVQ